MVGVSVLVGVILGVIDGVGVLLAVAVGVNPIVTEGVGVEVFVGVTVGVSVFVGVVGKSWDASGIAYNVEVWKQCLRVLKPGGHLLAFGGSRTWHRLAVAIEDAGFEMR